ncbi:MAG: Asp23/Gls24 family envelope stress response protein [Bacillota bacterium]|nr:Asp23/Gls24 family envelope stress response protein [Clostridiales bacterium]MDD6764077.1 Asp23/Gls24 family envelope stress response protein [Bacillota bacterium]MDO4472684.1 Asp23/Gls24 family envelope stress response protein [Bacillota bacterium]
MKVYSLSGKSGTGKSYQAINLCRKMNIESIIDDGLFICRNKVIAGISAKRQPTKVGAVKAALFTSDEQQQEVVKAIQRVKPKSLLVLGTSDEMIDKIVARLELPSPEKRVYIEDITTEEEREIAAKQRKEMGQHVIPAPTFQIKRQFSGYFMSPLKFVKDFGPWGSGRHSSEKSIVRPTFSYMGKYRISDKVMSDIVECIKDETESIYEVQKVIVTQRQEASHEGIDVYVVADMKYGENLPDSAVRFQNEIAEKIEEMTAFNVIRVDMEIRDVV